MSSSASKASLPFANETSSFANRVLASRGGVTADTVLNYPATTYVPVPSDVPVLGKQKQGNQLVNWVCTLFPDNFPDDGCTRTIDAICGNATYAVFGLELAPTTRRAHIHGVVVFNERVRLTQLKKSFPNCIHWEPMMGTLEQAVAYATKEDKEPKVFGTPPVDPGQLEKNRWEQARTQLRTGDVEALTDAQIYVQHFSAVERIADRWTSKLAASDLSIMPMICWFEGVPGSGKSQLARKMLTADGAQFYQKDFTSWWDNYDPNIHSGVLIEDIGLGDVWIIDRLKMWTDRYAFPAQRKGRPSLTIRPLRIIITSNFTPERLFGSNPINVEAMMRRCDLYHFPKKFDPNLGEPQYTVIKRDEPNRLDALEAYATEVVKHIRRAKPGTVSTFHGSQFVSPVVDLTKEEDEDEEYEELAFPVVPLVKQRHEPVRSSPDLATQETTQDLDEDSSSDSSSLEEEEILRTPTPVPKKLRRSETVAPGAPERTKKQKRNH